MATNSNPKILKKIAVVMLCVSFGLIIAGVYFYQKEDKFLNQCRLLICKVTEIEEKRFGKAYVTFADVNGKVPPFKYYVEYDASESELGFNENEIHEIYYYEKDPAQSQVKSFFENHLTSFILIIIGVVFIIDFPILLMVSSKTQKQQLAKSQYGIKDEVISE